MLKDSPLYDSEALEDTDEKLTQIRQIVENGALISTNGELYKPNRSAIILAGLLRLYDNNLGAVLLWLFSHQDAFGSAPVESSYDEIERRLNAIETGVFI